MEATGFYLGVQPPLDALLVAQATTLCCRGLGWRKAWRRNGKTQTHGALTGMESLRVCAAGLRPTVAACCISRAGVPRSAWWCWAAAHRAMAEARLVIR